MSLSRRRFIFISATAVAFPTSATSGDVNSVDELIHWKGSALGAPAMLAFAGLSKPQAAQHVARIKVEISRLEKIFSLYHPNSVLSRLNASGKFTAPPLEFAQLLTQVSAIHKATNGAFDPTVQPLWLAYANAKGYPHRETVKRARKAVGWHRVEFSANQIAFTRPDMAITLNGIAQGFITDKIADLLRANGLENVVVSVGEIAAIGERSPGAGWKIGIGEKQGAIAQEYLFLSNSALATTAQLGTTLDDQSKIGHIIDPRTGSMPNLWRRNSIIHPSAAIADGLSTAFALMQRNEMISAMGQFSDARLIAIDNKGVRFTASSPRV